MTIELVIVELSKIKVELDTLANALRSWDQEACDIGRDLDNLADLMADSQDVVVSQTPVLEQLNNAIDRLAKFRFIDTVRKADELKARFSPASGGGE